MLPSPVTTCITDYWHAAVGKAAASVNSALYTLVKLSVSVIHE